jgi:hypothetical protein
LYRIGLAANTEGIENIEKRRATIVPATRTVVEYAIYYVPTLLKWRLSPFGFACITELGLEHLMKPVGSELQFAA